MCCVSLAVQFTGSAIFANYGQIVGKANRYIANTMPALQRRCKMQWSGMIPKRDGRFRHVGAAPARHRDDADRQLT